MIALHVLQLPWPTTTPIFARGTSLIQARGRRPSFHDNLSGPSVRVGGTPTAAGTFTWTLQLIDAHGLTTTRDFTATVDPALPAIP
jgi:hypothetical protein